MEGETFSIRSLSPTVMHHVSPLRGASRMSNIQQTKKKIALINKSLYKQDIDSHPILRLEKAVLRGRGIDKEIKIRVEKKGKETSYLEQTLKKEHKICNEGTQIVKLPKLPFGHHSSYNEEEEFLQSHFVPYESTQAVQELRTLSRRFKLGDRIKSKRSHSKGNSANCSKGEIVVYDMENGQLFSNVNKEIIESYEADRSKYLVKHHYAYQTFRNVDTEELLKSKLYLTKRSRDLKGMVRRLYKQPEKKVTDLSKELTSKYNLLFQDNTSFSGKFSQTFDF
jgi:hypothetical protein